MDKITRSTFRINQRTHFSSQRISLIGLSLIVYGMMLSQTSRAEDVTNLTAYDVNSTNYNCGGTQANNV